MKHTVKMQTGNGMKNIAKLSNRIFKRQQEKALLLQTADDVSETIRGQLRSKKQAQISTIFHWIFLQNLEEHFICYFFAVCQGKGYDLRTARENGLGGRPAHFRVVDDQLLQVGELEVVLKRDMNGG